MNKVLRQNLLLVSVTTALIYFFSFVIVRNEAIFWTILDAIPMLFLSMIKYSTPLQKKYKLVTLCDILLPIIFFSIVSFINPNEMLKNAYRLFPGLIFFATMGCISKIIFDALRAWWTNWGK